MTPLSFVLNKLWTFSSVRSRPALPPREDADEPSATPATGNPTPRPARPAPRP